VHDKAYLIKFKCFVSLFYVREMFKEINRKIIDCVQYIYSMPRIRVCNDTI